MWNLEQALILAICFAGLVGFVYTWFFLWKASVEHSLRRREWVIMAAIILVSLAGALWFVMPAFWGTDFGEKVRVAEILTRASGRVCAVALVLALIGRPRLIVPIGLACIGTATFWVMSTIP